MSVQFPTGAAYWNKKPNRISVTFKAELQQLKTNTHIDSLIDAFLFSENFPNTSENEQAFLYVLN